MTTKEFARQCRIKHKGDLTAEVIVVYPPAKLRVEFREWGHDLVGTEEYALGNPADLHALPREAVNLAAWLNGEGFR